VPLASNRDVRYLACIVDGLEASLQRAWKVWREKCSGLVDESPASGSAVKRVHDLAAVVDSVGVRSAPCHAQRRAQCAPIIEKAAHDAFCIRDRANELPEIIDLVQIDPGHVRIIDLNERVCFANETVRRRILVGKFADDLASVVDSVCSNLRSIGNIQHFDGEYVH
jgi:hypothetical protein